MPNFCKCGAEISPFAIRCRKCITDKATNHETVKVILKCHDAGITMIKTADTLGITKQRVDQIYKRERGRYWSEEKKRKKMAELNRIIERANTVKFVCKNCHKPVLWKDAGNAKIYCTIFCNKEFKSRFQRNFKKTNVCVGCGINFHPYRGFPDQPFHNRKCYFKNMNKRAKRKSKLDAKSG